jgi:hypothetical protein
MLSRKDFDALERFHVQGDKSDRAGETAAAERLAEALALISSTSCR